MRKFLLKLATLLLVIFIPFLAIEGIITYKLSRNFVVTLHSDWHALENHNSEILFIGNSRIWTFVNTDMVTEFTNASCENLAQDGQGINVLWHKFRAYLKGNRKPKEIYILTDPAFLEKRHDLYRFDRFQPYLFMDRYDIGILKNYDEYRLAYKYMPLLAVKDQALKFLLNKSDLPEEYEVTKGFTIFDLKWKEGYRWNKPPPLNVFDKEGIAYLDTFNRYCENEHIRCYFICTPMSYPTYLDFEGSLYPEFKRYLNEEMGIYYSDFNGKTYNDPTLFIDHRHISAKGSDVFMQQLLSDTTLFQSFRKP